MVAESSSHACERERHGLAAMRSNAFRIPELERSGLTRPSGREPVYRPTGLYTEPTVSPRHNRHSSLSVKQWLTMLVNVLRYRMAHTNPLTAVGYLRASTDDQKLGPEAQRASIESWAAANGVTVIAWHCDAGVSGGSDMADRPELMAAIGALKAHRAGVLVVAKRDRLARDVYVAVAIERAVVRCGARIVTADGVANGDTAADAFLRTILDGAAQYERALIRGRTKAALAAKRARGERAGNVPFGFTADATGRLTANEGEQRVIAHVRTLRASGLTLRGIVAQLASAGFVGRTGNALALPQVARIARAA